GLRVAATPGLTTTCTGGTLAAPAGAGSIVVTGATVGASTATPTTCTISVNVTNQPGQVNASCANLPTGFTNTAAHILGVTNLNTTTVTPSCVTVTGVAFTITKTSSSGQLPTNSPLTFTIAVTNNGPSDASGSLLTDPAIAGFTATGITCSGATGGGSCPPGANVTIGNLQGAGIALTTFPAGSTITFVLSGTFTQTAGSVTNVATITTPPGIPVQTAQASSSVAVLVPGPTQIPTLSEWMLALLALILGGFAMRAYRRRF